MEISISLHHMVHGKKLTTDDRHSTITIAHSEHFVLRRAKNLTSGFKEEDFLRISSCPYSA